jgi:hypothetical protein
MQGYSSGHVQRALLLKEGAHRSQAAGRDVNVGDSQR